MVSSINNGNHLVSGSNLVQHPPPPSLVPPQRWNFCFVRDVLVILYKLAVLLMCMRFELWGYHLARLKKLEDESGLD